MISPFSTFEEFSEAKGPIYTFANNPTMIAILLLLCVAITCYFVYTSFQIGPNSKPNPTVLSALLLAGTVSLFGSMLSTQQQKPVEAHRPRPASELTRTTPLALLGMTVTGALFGSRKSARQSGRQSGKHPGKRSRRRR
jgi:hypothetical protein